MKDEFKNTNSKDIWNNSLLCSQLLRGHTDLPLFKDVQPEDIEDVTEKFRPFLGVEFEGDAVKKIRIHGKREDVVYVVGLLEHKSDVDYDVTFQLLKYMVGIWTLYRNEQNNSKKGSSARKGFKYPLIIPIVYYEGKEKWTAQMHWKERVELSEMFGEYVPDFTYRLVDLHRYSNQDLLSKEEELSLVMLLNRVQTREDLDMSQWKEAERRAAEKIIRKAPEAVLNLLVQMVHHMGLKLHLPDEEVQRCVKNMEDREMGELWANMDKIDIQEERRSREEARKKIEKLQKENEDIQKNLQEAQDTITQKDVEITQKDKDLKEAADTITQKDKDLKEAADTITQKDKDLKEAKDEIARLRKELDDFKK